MWWSVPLRFVLFPVMFLVLAGLPVWFGADPRWAYAVPPIVGLLLFVACVVAAWWLSSLAVRRLAR